MATALPTPTKEVDIEFLVFVERYATDLLKWDILTFFAHNPDKTVTAAALAQLIGRNIHSVRPELGDFTMFGVLEQLTNPAGESPRVAYRLTQQPRFRATGLKMATQAHR